MRITIETLSEARIKDADRIFRSAFEINESREAGIRHMLKFQPDGYFMAFWDGAPAGMVGAVDYGSFAYVGMMAVERRFQRKGIGSALMHHLMKWIDERGIPAVYLDATASGEKVYRRFGFEPCEPSHLLALRIPPGTLIKGDNLHSVTAAHIPSLKHFDTPVFGADRSRLFHLILESGPHRAFLSLDENGAVDGFIFARTNRIGPWVARSRDTARQLLHAALALPFDQSPTVTVSGANPHAVDLLEACGFSYILSNRHMRRGQSGAPEQRDWVYGQSSFAEG